MPAVLRNNASGDDHGRKRLKTTASDQPTLLWTVENSHKDKPPRLRRPYDVTFPGDDRVVVTEGFWPYSRLQVFNMEGKSVGVIAQGEVLPFGVTTNGDELVITDHKERTVKTYTADGQLKDSWPANLFSWPNGIARTRSDNYVVADWGRGTLSIHNAHGTLINHFQTNASQQSCPEYVAVDEHDRILISDTFDHTIKGFAPNGKLLFESKTANSGDEISDPRGVCVDQKGHILLADWGNNRVVEYSPDGMFMRTVLGSEQVQFPWGLALNTRGLLAVTEQKLDASPTLKLFQY